MVSALWMISVPRSGVHPHGNPGVERRCENLGFTPSVADAAPISAWLRHG